MSKAKERKDGSWLNINGFTIGGGVTFGYLNNEFGGNIMVSFPPSSIWRFSSNVIRIVDIDTGKEYLVNFEKLLPQFHLKVSFTSPILGRGSGLRTEASTDIVVSENPFESLVFQLPALLINDEEIAIKPIEFKKGFGFGLIPFNY